MGDALIPAALDWNAAFAAALGLGAKSVLLLAATALFVLAMRRASAARRHMVWLLGLGAVALLPLLALFMPRWVLPVLPGKPSRPAATQTADRQSWDAPGSTAHATASSAISSAPPNSTPPASAPENTQSTAIPETIASPAPPIASTPPRNTLPASFWTLLAWLAGAIGFLLPQLAGVFAMRRWIAAHPEIADPAVIAAARAQCSALRIRHPVALRTGGEGTMPLAAGFFRATIFLPVQARDWPGEKLRAVLAHELAHVRRRDCLTQALARAVAALYWFNPLAWLAVRQLRIERERACDDLVLQAGQSPTSYALQLVAIAREMRAHTPVAAAAVMMARPSQIEGRVRSVLTLGVNRRGVSRPFLLFGAGFVLLIAATIGGMIFSGQTKTQAIDTAKDFHNVMWSGLQQSWEATDMIGDQGDDPMRPILVIDLDASEMRLERPGGVRPHERIALPADFDWELVRWNNNGMQPVASPVRLRVRTRWETDPYGNRNKFYDGSMLGMLELRGTHHPTGQQFGMQIQNGGGGWHTGFTTSYRSSETGDEKVVPMYVDDAEYATARQAWAAAPADSAAESSIALPAEAAGDLQQAWSQFRVSMMDQLRRHMESKGWQRVDFRDLNVNDDLRRGHMRVDGFHRGGLLGRGGHTSLFGFGHGYDFEYLGGASWAMMGRGGLAGDNFVLSGRDEQDAAAWDAEFMQALKSHHDWIRHLYEWDANFTATLTNGTKIEIVGFSEGGRRGDAWWKPDGTPLDWQPFIIPEDTRPLHEKDGRRWLAIAYRASNTQGSTSRMMPGSDGSASGTAVDPWGRSIVYMNTSLNVGSRERFASSQQTAEFNFSHTDPAGNSASLTVHDLSLVPGHITRPVFEGDLLTATRPDLWALVGLPQNGDFVALPLDIMPTTTSQGAFEWLQATSDYLRRFDAWPDGDAHDPTVQGNLEEVVWQDIRDSEYYRERVAFADALERQFLPLWKWVLETDATAAPAPMQAENYVMTLRKVFDVSHELLAPEFPELSVRVTENIMAPALDLMQQAVEKYHDPLEAFGEGSTAAHTEWVANQRKGTLAHMRKMQSTQPAPAQGVR